MAAGGMPGGAAAGRYFTHQYQRDSTDRAVAGEEDTRRPALCRITRIDSAGRRVYYQADVRGGKKGDPLVADFWMFVEVAFGAWADKEGEHDRARDAMAAAHEESA